MKEQIPTRETNRREMLKLSGMGVLGGVAAGTLAPGTARANAAVNISYASWIHGHSLQVEYPERVDVLWRAGFYVDILNKPGTDNWLHFAIPTPVIIDDVRLRADSVMLRFKTGSGDAWINAVHVYDGSKLIALHENLKLSGDHPFDRFVVPDRPLVEWGIGISVGISVGVEQMGLDHSMQFIAAGCDFTTREPQ